MQTCLTEHCLVAFHDKLMCPSNEVDAIGVIESRSDTEKVVWSRSGVHVSGSIPGVIWFHSMPCMA